MRRMLTLMEHPTCEGDDHTWRRKAGPPADPQEDDRCACLSYTWAQAGKIEAEEAAAQVDYEIDETMRADIINRFTYHAPKRNQLPRYETLRAEGHALAKKILLLTPKSREQALALTKLEEAIMFANAAIARHE